MSEAEKHLRENQKQLDSDGTMVGVSRQALEEFMNETKHCNWIEVPNGTPELVKLKFGQMCSHPVLVFIESTMEMTTAIYQADGNWWSDQFNHYVYNVTDWYDLPALPARLKEI